MQTQFLQFSHQIALRAQNSIVNDVINPINQFKNLLDYILLNDIESYKISEFWFQDYQNDSLSQLQIDMVTKINFDRFKHILIHIQPNQIVQPVIQRTNVVNASSLAQAYQMQYQIQQQQVQDQDNLIQMKRLNSNLIQQLFGNNGIINEILLKELNSVDLNVLDDSKNHISVASAMRWAGVADIDYIKASVLFYIIRLNMINTHQQFINKNTSWLIIYIATIMQKFEQQFISMKQQFQQGKQFFVTDQYLQASEKELFFLQQNNIFGINEDDSIIAQRITVQIRPAYSRLHALDNIRTIDSIDIQGQQSIFNQQQSMLQTTMDQLVQNGLGLSTQYKQQNMKKGLKGALMTNIAMIVNYRLKQYIKSIQSNINQNIIAQNDVQDCIVLISAVFQVPIISPDVNRSRAQDQAMRRINQEYRHFIINRSQDNIKILQESQVDNVQGWSKYYTIAFQIKISDSWNALLGVDVSQIDSQIRQEIANKLVQIVDNYGDDEEQSDQAFIIASGFIHSMLNKLIVRPVIQLRQSITTAQRDIIKIDIDQQIKKTSNKNNTDYLNPFNKRQQRERARSSRYSQNEYEVPVHKQRKIGPQALYSCIDIQMESLYNDLDQAQYDDNCCYRVAVQLSKYSQTVKNNIQAIEDVDDIQKLIQFIQMIETIDEKYYFIYIKYNTVVLQPSDIEYQISLQLKHQQQLILFISDYHVFCSSLDSYKKHLKQQNEKSFINKAIQIDQTIFKHICFRGEKVAQLSKYYINRIKKQAYFDFETTFNDTNAHQFVHKGVKQRQGLESYEQVEFAYSIVINIKIKFNDIIQALQDEYSVKLDQVKSRNLIMKQSQESFFGLRCGIQLIYRIQELQKLIQQYIDDYNFDVQNFFIKLKNNNEQNIIDQIRITHDIQLYSYNGAKFDNHFILSAIKDIEGENWFEHVQFTGTQQDMKIMIFKGMTFADMKLMTGGTSLKQFCKDLNIQNEMRKIDIDMQKMKTYSLAQQHKEEIMKYVMNDSLALYEIHRCFEKSIRKIIIDYLKTQINTKYNMVMSQNLEYFENHQQLDQFQKLFKYMKGIFINWYTISSLSMSVFKKFFLNYTIQSNPKEQVYKFMQDSYQGGYTQSFVIGKVPDQAFYFDYNSMYPAIMSNIKVPVNLNQCELIEFKNFIHLDAFNSSEMKSELGLHVSVDPLQHGANGLYQMQVCYGHYDLFELDEFEFDSACQSPSFGMRTKQHGTIYVIQFSFAQCKEQLLAPVVVFGFQIIQAIRNKQLKSFKVSKQLKFMRDEFHPKFKVRTFTQPIFREFDQYMYEARLKYKQNKNSTMAQCVKLFINSLYGKFGEKHHNIQFNMHESDIDDEQKFHQIIRKHINAHKGIDINQCNSADLASFNIKLFPMFDLNDRDSNSVRVCIDDAPMVNNHIGSYVYYASLITAIGRTQIIQIAQKLFMNQCQVYYIDTDSIITNEKGSQLMQNNPQIAKIDSQILGHLKNEYPANNDQQLSAIKQLIVFNKKIYQYYLDNAWVNKFKGCRDAGDDMQDAFMNGDCKYSCKQTRFKKDNANVTIIDMEMHYKLRLSRQVNEQGKYVPTNPYLNLQSLRNDYKQSSSHILFDQQLNRWRVNQI